MFVKAVGKIVLVLLAGLIVLDVIVDVIANRTRFANEIVDIQGPETLLAKLELLRSFDGYKIAVLGDSFIYGQALSEHGDREWRAHTFPRLIEKRLATLMDHRDVLALNLGMNGATPADIERLTQLVVTAGVDLVVVNLTLRSFSADFSSPDAQLSRPWLTEITIEPNGTYLERGDGTPLSNRIELHIKGFLLNHWALYRLRELTQWRLFGNPPREVVRSVRDALNRVFLVGTWTAPVASPQDKFLTLLKAKGRYSSVNFAPQNPQRQALERTLAYLDARSQPTIVFYTTENPEFAPHVLDQDRLMMLRQTLDALVGNYIGARLRYIPATEALKAEHFVDYIHTNHAGYLTVLDKIWPELKAQARIAVLAR